MPKIITQKTQIIGQQILTGSIMCFLTVLMLSPVTHCHAGCIYVSAPIARNIKIDLDLASFSQSTVYSPQFGSILLS